MCENKEFQFKPRHEAHPMKWDELLSPVRRAVADLLIRIDGAEQVNEGRDNKDKKEVANCFLVSGIRGTGKTTVLLSAKEAVCSQDFFAEKLDKEAQAAKKSVDYLKEKHIVWLPILDLEPLIANSNLLTTVLTRVRNALEQTGCSKKDSALTSIFEESTDSARQQFNQLIHDATLIWEDIQEADTRGKASRQVAAADIYASFRERFQKAMTALSEQLSRLHGRESNGCSIVLPIDNIDRSTDHLHAIVKLAQLVSHSRLWLVMAGDRVDVETFLERAYWKELIYSKNGASARGKKRWDGEDEVLVMARRQAAAAYQKLLPPSHRIEIDRVKPNETLKFRPSANEKNIHQLLEQINIFLNESREDGRKICFTDLLGARNFVETSEAINLTHFAWHGLHLPARTVLDLWQLAHCVVEDTTTEKKFQAEKIARTMLRNAIFRSDMSSSMGERLQHYIIDRSTDGGTVLNWENVDLNVSSLPIYDFERPCCTLNIPKEKPSYTIRPKLCIWKEVDIYIYLRDKNNKKSAEKLPDIVAAWLSILYDILILVERPAVIGGTEIKTYIVAASHEVIIANQRTKKDSPKEFWWSAPLWDTFLAYDVFWQRWTKFRDNLPKKKPKNDDLTRLLVAGWVACVLKTYAELNHLNLIDSILARKLLEEKGVQENERQISTTEEYINEFEKEVIRATHAQYSVITSPSKPQVLIEEKAMKDWLEKKLPLLFSYLYVPMDNEDLADSRCKAIFDDCLGKKSELAVYWQDNALFFLADLDAELEALFPRDKTPYKISDSDDMNVSDGKYRQYINSLGPFGALHRYWKVVLPLDVSE